MGELMVYHGTDCLFDEVDLLHSRDSRDFGRGFYTTTIAAQAESWARAMRVRRGGSAAIVYEFELVIPKGLSVKRFDGMTFEWLDFIRDNRTGGGLTHGYDVVMGPVADDNTLLTVNRYLQGVYSADEALERLAFFRANDQVSLHTADALKHLKLVRRYCVEP